LVEHVKGDEVVASEAQVLKRFLQTLGLIVKVRDDYDDAAARQYFGELMQRLGEMSFACGFKHREIAEDRTHVTRAIACGHVRVDFVGETDEADGVLLSIQ
jgi:hypothetical protein